ncbi:hypothetical protein BD410DRAFT_723977, partial [Rickenella mellea]
LLFYDYALTLPTEVAEIWSSKFTGAHALFYLTRYSFIIRTIAYFGLKFHTNPTDLVS